jgi:predicted metal-dependent HD superfamily phosphohydrolase
MTSSLNQRWSRVWSQLGITYIPNNVFAELTRAYSSPGRYYHNLTHIKDCLRVFDEAKELAERPAEVELAIWFHDAIYDTRASGNEQQSADWAHRVITELGLGSAIAERVDKLIYEAQARENLGQAIDRLKEIVIS